LFSLELFEREERPAADLPILLALAPVEAQRHLDRAETARIHHHLADGVAADAVTAAVELLLELGVGRDADPDAVAAAVATDLVVDAVVAPAAGATEGAFELIEQAHGVMMQPAREQHQADRSLTLAGPNPILGA
jgi:hypothetical protein